MTELCRSANGGKKNKLNSRGKQVLLLFYTPLADLQMSVMKL